MLRGNVGQNIFIDADRTRLLVLMQRCVERFKLNNHWTGLGKN